ncbi:hypothetical protein [Streptomyces sp. NPDC059783]|uniref:hypothetical protein n=1 Tax=Streptomyces sp. NPDC059783 TaxID=3346944 RepID=UPI003660AD98
MEAHETAAAVAEAYPGLRRTSPFGAGAALSDVRLDATRTATYSWSDYKVHVGVGLDDHLGHDPDDASVQRRVRATATLLVTGVPEAEPRGHVEWAMPNPRPEIVFPAVTVAADDDLASPEFASAVLSAVAGALDCARTATAAAARTAETAAREAAWERERPHDVPRGRWLRQKRAEYETGQAPGR